MNRMALKMSDITGLQIKSAEKNLTFFFLLMVDELTYKLSLEFNHGIHCHNIYVPNKMCGGLRCQVGFYLRGEGRKII